MKIQEADLRRLYIEENKTDKDIASIYGVTFGTICNLRRKYGIKGINARHRVFFNNPQKEISQRQKSIIFGSLLGDACLKSRTNASAYLSISHSIKQKEYSNWLYNELRVICHNPPKEYISKGKYITFDFQSESRKDLLEIRSKIYTPSKKVSKWWLDNLDALSVAVWFMDDGTLSYVNKIKSIYSFATNSFSMEENYLLSDFLQSRFGITSEVKPITKKSGIQYNLIVSDGAFDKFTKLIETNIVECMRYKLPNFIHNNGLIDNIEANIGSDMLSDLYYKHKLTQKQIGNVLGVHKSTISKYMDIFKIPVRNNDAAQLKGINNNCERDDKGKFLSLAAGSEDEIVANKLFSEMRGNGFPYTSIKSDEHYIGVLDSMCLKKKCDMGDGGYMYSRSGMEICSALCPQIFSMGTNSSKTPMEIFNNDDMFFDCIKRTIKYAKKDSVAAVRQGLKTYKNNRCVTVFPPMWAGTVVVENFGDRNNLSVLDFSAGFGGRLLGSYASGKVAKYVGIDPLSSNIHSLTKMNNLIATHAKLRHCVFESELTCSTAENKLDAINEKFDLVLTSPPYFNKEVYSNDSNQCYVKYPDYDIWKNEWLTPLLVRAYDLLSDNGKMIIFASNSQNTFADDCSLIMGRIGNQPPTEMRFLIPSLEYFRARNIKRMDTAYIISKNKTA